MTLTLDSHDGMIVYELTDDGSLPRLPTPASPPYNSPLILTGRSGASVTYRLLARTINDLGIASRAARIVAVTVDRTLPPAPAEPRVMYAPENPSVAYLAWDQLPAGRLLYRLSAGSSGPASDFIPYTGPVSVSVAGTGGVTISGEAVVENPAGIRGNSTAFSVAVGKRLQAPMIRGARDGAVSTQKVELKLSSQAGEVRYEIATDGGFPPAVTASSALAPDPLVIDASEGQTVSARIAARAFDPSGAALPSDETQFSLTVDKTPPDPPVASGIEDAGYYQDSRRVTLLSAEGSIYYTLSTGPEPAMPGQTDAYRYTGDLLLEAKPGQAVTYRIVAFTVDDAGNRSREIRSWAVTIDQKIVYAAPSGNDYADGSRSAPVRSLSRALQIAGSTSRKTVYAAAGQYTLDSQLTLLGDVTLVGGLDPDAWTPLGLERWSTISSSTPWRSGASLVSMAKGRVAIQGFELIDGAGALQSLVAVWDGDLSMENDSLRLKGDQSGQGIIIHGGSVTLSHSRLQATGVHTGSLLSATGGTFSAAGTEFDGPDNAIDFTCIDLSDVKGGTLKGITILPGSGQRTRGIRAARSQISVSASQLQSGAGVVEATAIDARDSDITVEDTDVAATDRGQSPTAILSVTSSLLVSHSRITAAGAASAVGISARGGDLAVSRSTLKGAATPEYVSLIKAEDVRSLIANSILIGGDAGESVCMLVKGGATDIVNNTILAGTGSGLTAGILVQGDVLPRFVNNIIARAGLDRGGAIVVMGAHAALFPSPSGGTTMPVVLTNSFSGWKSVFHVDYASDASLSPLDLVTVSALNDADGDHFGGTMAGNVEENPGVSFRSSANGEEYRLVRGSACVDAGTDLSDPYGLAGTGPLVSRKGLDIIRDMNDKPRPGQGPLQIPGPLRGWDIGAFQYSG
ncbi:MAG: hypothetical protein ABSF77_20605 [Spirochaetia bacterium]